MNVLLLLATVLGVSSLLLGALVSVAMGLKLRAALFGGLAAGWVVLYGGGLIVASLTSRETVLPVGATKRFCGFYLDCHIGVAVLDDSTPASVGSRRSAGTFHVLTLQLSSNAVRATLRPYDLRIQLVGTDGTRYERDRAAERELSGAGTGEPLERDIPAGGSYTARVVFALPPGATAQRLFVGEGGGVVDWLVEGALIGDEDSFLHRKTMLALPG